MRNISDFWKKFLYEVLGIWKENFLRGDYTYGGETL